MRFVTTSTNVLLHALSGTLFLTSNGMHKNPFAPSGHVRTFSDDCPKIEMKDSLISFRSSDQDVHSVLNELAKIPSESRLKDELFQRYKGRLGDLLRLADLAHEKNCPVISDHARAVYQTWMYGLFCIWFRDVYMDEHEKPIDNGLVNTLTTVALCQYRCPMQNAESIDRMYWHTPYSIGALVRDDSGEDRVMLHHPISRETIKKPLVDSPHLIKKIKGQTLFDGALNQQGTYKYCLQGGSDDQKHLLLYDARTSTRLADHLVAKHAVARFSQDGNRVLVLASGNVDFYEVPRQVTTQEAMLLRYLSDQGMNKALDQIGQTTIEAIVKRLW